jgi:hypothetical protein
MPKTIADHLKEYGEPSRLATGLRITRSTVSLWRKWGSVPERWVAPVARFYGIPERCVRNVALNQARNKT